MRISDSHQNETPKLSLDDVLVGAFKIAKTVVCVSLNSGNVFTLISDNMSTFGRNKNLSYFDILEKFHTTPFRQKKFNGALVQ